MPMQHVEVGALSGIVNPEPVDDEAGRPVCCSLDASNMPKIAPVVHVSALDEKAMAAALNLSPSWLRHDRAGARRIPYYKIGKTVRYNPQRVAEALAKLEEGGAA